MISFLNEQDIVSCGIEDHAIPYGHKGGRDRGDNMSLPLATFFELMGFNNWHAFGWADNDALAITSSCNPVMFEDASQGYDQVGRSDIRGALETAENLVFQIAQFYPAPRFYEKEVQWSQLKDRRFSRIGPYNEDARWKSTRINDGWVQDCGIEGLTAIQLNAPVTLLDVNGDGYPDYFQIGPIATALTDPREIAVYFNSVDRYDGTGIEGRWRVEPIQASIVGGQLTIRGRPWLIGRPVLSTGINPQILNPATTSNFASSLDVYRRFVNNAGTTTSTSQAVIIWETRPCHGWWCTCGPGGCCSCTTDPFVGALYDPRATAQATARVGIRDGRRGVLTPAEAILNPTTGIWEGFPTTICWEPDRVLLRLYAGYPLQSNGQMSRFMQDIVARITAAELVQDICGCSESSRRLHYWQQDMSKVGADKELFAAAPQMISNPLGSPRRGHWWALNQLTTLARVRGTRT